jgi:hypothetical protein
MDGEPAVSGTAVSGRVVILRFAMRDARLFSFRFTPVTLAQL